MAFNNPSGFLSIEEELLKRRKQADSVRGKDTPFRVEFRYRGGTKHWQYFCTAEDTAMAEDSSCSYSPQGNARIERPRSQVVQVRGSRGGWSNLKKGVE
jgi:hypothetical protein